jgi:hypothetical protein
MTSAASASVGLIEKVNEAASTKLDQASSAVMDFFDFGDIKKVEQTGEFVLTEEMLERGLTEEEYLRVVEIKKKENRDLATYIDSIQEGLEADKKIIDSIYDEYNQTMYDWDLYVNRYDSNVRDLYNHIKHGYPDYEMLKEYGLSVEDGNLTFEKFCEKSHKGDAYIEYLNIRNDYIEEQFNRLEATKGFKYQDYEKFLEIKKNNLTNLEILRGTEKNNDNEYAQMEYNLLTLLEDFKNTKDLDKLIENPIGDEKYVNELGGQYLEIYNYLKKTDSKKASEYLLAIEDPINQLKGTEKAMQRIALLSKDSDGNIEDALLNEIMVAVTGFNDGVYDFGEGLCKIIDDDMTVQDYEVMVYMSYLTSMQSNIYSTFQSAGNMVIPMSVSTAISILAPETSPLILSGISSTLIGGSSYGQTKAQMLYEGYDRKKAMAYAAWSATSDAVLEAALGGIENIGISTMLDGAGKLTLRKFAVKQLREMVQEGGEEVIQDLFKSAVIDDIVLGKEFNFDEFSEGAAKTFFQSALVAGLLNGGKSTINLVVHNTQITLNEEDLQDILQRSNNGEDINDIVSAVLARKVNGGNSSVIESIDNSTNTQDNASNITPIKVSEIESSNSKFEKVFNVKNVYTGYDYVYKADSNIDSVIDQVISDNLGGNILIEVGRFDVLSEEIINKLPDNVNVRVIGAYDTDTMNSFKNPASAENSGRNTIYTKEQLLSVNEKLTQIDSLVDENWSDQEKVEFLYKYLRDNVPYNVRPVSRDAKYESLVGLIEDESTCQGFAHIFDELCSRYGIECKEIFGTFDGHTSHAYNVVKIDGKDYVVDCVREHLDGKNGCLTSGDDISNYTSRGVNGYLLDSAKANTHSITTDVIENSTSEIESIDTTDENVGNTKSYLSEISGSDNLSASQQNGIDSSLQSLAFKIGSDSATVKEALDDKLVELINDSEFGVRVDEKALASIIDGGLKNQFETHSSGGALNISKRTSAEKNMFNVPTDSEASDRPVYGMLFPKYDDYSQYYKRGPGSFYAILQQRDSNGKLELDSSGHGIIVNNPETGERYSSAVILMKKDSVIDNTTFTLGDSLDVGIRKLDGQATIQGSLATNPTFKGADNRIFDSINSIDDIKNADLQTLFPANDFRSNRYMELQIHGQENHDVSNIKEVIFTSGTVSDSIIKKLESKGIPYKIMPRFE